MRAAGWAALRSGDHPLRDDLQAALRKLAVGARGLPPRAAALEAGGAIVERARARDWVAILAEAVERHAADRVPELLPAVADDPAAYELGAEDLDARDLLRDGLGRLGRDPHGLASDEALPRQGRPRREDEDDAAAHAVEALDLRLGHGIAEGQEQDDREGPPHDPGEGQGGPQRLQDEVPEEVAEEDSDHLISRGGLSTTLSPSLRPSRISMFKPSESPVRTSTFFGASPSGTSTNLLPSSNRTSRSGMRTTCLRSRIWMLAVAEKPARSVAPEASLMRIQISKSVALPSIKVLPPDVSQSGEIFTIEQRDDTPPAIRFGLAAIKNVGAAAIRPIIASREQGGPFMSIDDFCRRADLRNLNKRALESLIKAGALDSLGDRGALLSGADLILSLSQIEQRLKEKGQSTMFDLSGQSVDVPLPGIELPKGEISAKEKVAWEKELLGVYFSDNAFSYASQKLAAKVDVFCGHINEELVGQVVVTAGTLTSVRVLSTKDKRPFVSAVLEDFGGCRCTKRSRTSH